ncbi:unnamed protein product [Cyclocybe aegerita]|uniref:Uncharacterized protein n=1 Tax=Cyclocybe aegerita TaxID=1973307 RepID=A0A8S0X6P9_CYCAE|nr:unnamed protein product [Cyclocybe aegerita]
MFVRERTPLPCGPAFAGLRHSPINIGLAAGVVALQQSPFGGRTAVALATSGLVGGATLAYFVQAHFNRRVLAAPVNITSSNLYHTAIVHPSCPLGSSSFGSGDALGNLICPAPFDYGEPGPACDSLSQMNALELDNWFSTAISSCEVGDAPGTDLMVLPLVPPTPPLRSGCTDVGKHIPGDMIVYGTVERSLSIYHGATCPVTWIGGNKDFSSIHDVQEVSRVSEDLSSVHSVQKVSQPPSSSSVQCSTLEDLNLESIIVGLTLLSGLHKRRGIPLRTPAVNEHVPIKSISAVSVPSPRNSRLVPTMMDFQLAASALVAAGNPEPSDRTLMIAQHIRGVFNCLCVVFALYLIMICIFKASVNTKFKVSFNFTKRDVRTLPVALSSASVPANEESDESDDFFSLPSTPRHLDVASAEATQITPVEDQNVSSFVDTPSVVPKSEQEAAALVVEPVSEEAHLSNNDDVEEKVNEEIISSVELEPILDEDPSSTVSGGLDPKASPFVPTILRLSAASTSAALETVDDDAPLSPSAILTHVSARPPGRRRRKHHRKNKNKAVEITLKLHFPAYNTPDLQGGMYGFNDFDILDTQPRLLHQTCLRDATLPLSSSLPPTHSNSQHTSSKSVSVLTSLSALSIVGIRVGCRLTRLAPCPTLRTTLPIARVVQGVDERLASCAGVVVFGVQVGVGGLTSFAAFDLCIDDDGLR